MCLIIKLLLFVFIKFIPDNYGANMAVAGLKVLKLFTSNVSYFPEVVALLQMKSLTISCALRRSKFMCGWVCEKKHPGRWAAIEILCYLCCEKQCARINTRAWLHRDRLALSNTACAYTSCWSIISLERACKKARQTWNELQKASPRYAWFIANFTLSVQQ